MAAAIEKTGRHLIAREIIHRTETDPHRIVVAIVLTQRNTELGSFYTKRLIDKSLLVTTYIMKIAHIVTCKRIVARVIVL